MRVVYVDTLFFLNFGVDYLLLLLTSRIAGIYRSPGRLAAGAAVGGVLSLLLFFPSLPGPVWPLLQAGVCLSVILCTFGDGRPGKLMRLCGLFFLLTALLGGCVFGLAQFTRAIVVKNGVIYYEVSGGMMLAALAGLAAVTGTALGRGRAHVGRAYHEVRVEHRQRAIRFRALSDSGNLLRDPVSGRQIIVAEWRTVAPLLQMEEGELRDLLTGTDRQKLLEALRQRSGTPFWLLPVSTAFQGGLMPVFRPETLLVDGKKRTDQLLGVTDAELKIGEDCRALMGV